MDSGLPGHIGAYCNRPILEVCSRNEEVVQLEIERAGTVRYVEKSLLEANTKRNEQSQDDRVHHGNNRRRSGDGNQSGNNRPGNQLARYDRGRQLHRQEQPQFRPFKSLPPPSQPKDRNDGQPHKRQRAYNDQSISSPSYKRAKHN
jgi:hypothetical protein